MIGFGIGKLLCVPTADATGTAIATNVATPVQLGTLQDVSVDLSFEPKMLYGNKQFPVAVGRGKGKLGFKAKTGEIDGAVLGSLFFGQTPGVSQLAAAIDVTGAIPTTPFQITPTVPGSGTWVADLGVYFSATGVQLKRVASAPTTGQYSVSAGVYTFAAADTGLGVVFNFEYTAASGGQSFQMTNQLMGYAPTFSALLVTPYLGKKMVLKFNSCISSKFSIPLKNEDFVIPDFDADAFADSSGNLGYMCLV